MRRPSSSKKGLLECASASVRFKYLRGATRIIVSRVTTPSCKAATAITGLIVEQGKKASARGIDGDNRAIVAAQRLDRRFANDRIVVLGYIILRGISKRWNAVARDGPVPNGSMCGPHGSRGPGDRRCSDGEVPCNQCTEHDCKDSIMAGNVSHIIPFLIASALPKRALS